MPPIQPIAVMLCFLSTCALAQQLPRSAQQLLGKIHTDTVVADLRVFEALGTKKSGSPACTQASHWLVDTYQALGYDSVQRTPIPRHALGFIASDSVFNVTCFKPGTAPAPPLIILCAHYDTQGGPGVNDNGSGTAALLSIARLLATTPTRNSVLFLHVAGEEQGLLGSSYFVNTLTTVKTTQTTVVMNLDVIGGTKNMDNRERVFAYDPSLDAPLRRRIQAYCDTMVTLTTAHTTLSTQSGPPEGLSDTESFTQAGVIAFGMHATSAPPTMHTAGDKLAALDTASTVEAVKAAAVAALYMAGLPTEVVSVLVPSVHSSGLALQPPLFTPVTLNGRRLGPHASLPAALIDAKGALSLPRRP